MADGLNKFNDVRCVPESTAGTKVDVATTRLMGQLSYPYGGPIIHTSKPQSQSLVSPNYPTKVGEELGFTFEGKCTFEQIIYLLSMGIIECTPTGSGPYVWTFKHNMSQPSTPKSLTLQFGDNAQAYDAEYVIAKSLEFSGAIDTPVMMKAELFGRNFEPTSWNPAAGALANPSALDTVLSNFTKLYIDLQTGTIGTTEKPKTITDWAVKIKTGYEPDKHGGDTLAFDSLAQDEPEVTVDLTIDVNDATEAERLIYSNVGTRLFQLEIAGTGDNLLTFQFAGHYSSFGPKSEKNGKNKIPVTVHVDLDTGFTDFFIAEVTNSIAALT